MKLVIRFLLLILFLSLIGIATSINCTDTKKCSCNSRPPRHGFLQNLQYYEFKCPPSLSDTGGAIVHVRENGTRLQIECHRSTYFDSSLFAKIGATNVTWIDIKKHCPLPRRESFEKLIRKLTSTKPLALAFERMQLTEQSLSKDHFKGLDQLQGLSLRFNQLRELDENVFANTPALTMINLQDNKIQLKPDLFKFTPKLNELDISVNGIQSLPDGLFDNLTNLKLLLLWNNRLQHLDGRSFKGLANLAVLQLAVNQIRTIAVDTFADLTKMTNLSLSYNLISDVPQDFLVKNKLLEEILLDYNPHLALSDYALANFENLKRVGLSHCNLTNVPANLFNGSTSLRVLRLDRNRLQYLPDKFFEGLGELTELNLAGNLLKLVPNFDGLRKLESLYLGWNALTRIDNEHFKMLTNLTVVNLEHNYITQIDDVAFPASLRRLSLAYNQYNFGMSTPFGTCVNLELLDLSNNLITTMRHDLVLNAVKLTELILNNNLINEVDFMHLATVSGGKIMLRYNNITKISFDSAKILANQVKTSRSTDVYLKGNPLKCDCNAYDLALYVQNKLHSNLKASVKLVPEEVICAAPKYLENNLVEEVALEVLSCSLDKSDCPHECNCSYEPHEDKVVYDCAVKNLTQIPDIVETKKRYNKTKVLLQGNALRRGPARGLTGWDDVTELYLSQNMIQNMTWVPPRLQVLTLDYNNLSSLPNHLLEFLNNSGIEDIRLDHNPWKCDCGAVNLTNFLREHSRLVDTEDIRCVKPPHTLLTKLHKHNLCEQPNLLARILTPVLVIGGLLLTASILAALYYKYERYIKVWLYANNLCLRWVTEEDLDKDKIFDVFISYAHQDRDFVADELMPPLERESYKVCVDYRNWVAGPLIGDQVIRSVNISRRTLVVLSSNYLQSKWGHMEFKAAHHRAMSDERARVIVVVKGDIAMEGLDEDLKSYLKMHTYVKWGDPWFWKKLRYALPHHRHRSLTRTDSDHTPFVPTYTKNDVY